MQPPNPQDDRPKVPPIPEMVGATSAPFSLGKSTTHISFDLHAPTGPALLRADMTPRRVFLKFEGITSKSRAPAFDVYLNLPPGDGPERHPDLHAGVLSMFGLAESSRSSENHPDHGLRYTKEVTNLFLRLSATKDWDGKSLHVSFVPKLWHDSIEVQVARVSLVIE